MLKSITLLTRKPELTHERFVHLWEHEHAPLAHAVPGLRRYVLSPVGSQPVRPDGPRHGIEVDGVAELWFDDAGAYQRALASPEMKKLRDHGATIIGKVETFITTEIQIIPKEGA